jgi:hypothetical protein
MLPGSDEGHLELSSLVRDGDEPLPGMPFDEETVRTYLKAPAIAAAARLCIGLTWEHRERLGI